MAHLVSSGDGLVVTVDRESGRERCVVLTCQIPFLLYEVLLCLFNELYIIMCLLFFR